MHSMRSTNRSLLSDAAPALFIISHPEVCVDVIRGDKAAVT